MLGRVFPAATSMSFLSVSELFRFHFLSSSHPKLFLAILIYLVNERLLNFTLCRACSIISEGRAACSPGSTPAFMVINLNKGGRH